MSYDCHVTCENVLHANNAVSCDGHVTCEAVLADDAVSCDGHTTVGECATLVM